MMISHRKYKGPGCRVQRRGVEMEFGCQAGEDPGVPTLARRPMAQRERLKGRRLRAAELSAIGVCQADVAWQLGVSAVQAISVWHARRQAAELTALHSRGNAEPSPQLSDPQLGEVEQALLDGTRANGLTRELSTADRGRDDPGDRAADRLCYHPALCVHAPAPRLSWTVPRLIRRATKVIRRRLTAGVAKHLSRVKQRRNGA
jgi:hypothetical protein